MAATITNGPCKMDLMLALFDASNDRPRPLVFSVMRGSAGSEAITVHVSSVQREGGSGESFNITALWQSKTDGGSFNVVMYYSTKTRTGYATPIRQ